MNSDRQSSVMPSIMTEEKKKIKRDFRFIDMLFYTIAAILGIDTLGAVSSYGGQALFWILFSAITFLLPYGLLAAELGSAFPQEGGVYEWSSRAFGRFYAALTTMFYWISNPLWIGGTMFVTVITSIKLFWFGNINTLLGGNKITDTVFTILISLVFIWGTIICVLLPMRSGKWLSIIGSILKLALLGLFVILALGLLLQGHAPGAHLQARDFMPTGDWSLIISGILPLLIFKWTGFEVQSGAGEEMHNPQRDVPRSLLGAGSVALVAYTIPIAVILLALNKQQIANSSGFLQAISNVFVILPAPLMIVLKIILVPAITITMASSGATWMGGANRTYAIAALDHAAPRALGRFSARYGTPITTTILCGVIATIAMVATVLITTFGDGSVQSLFALVLGFTVSINILSYLFIYPTFLVLRYKYPQVKRPYRVPGGKIGAWLVTILTTAYALVAVIFMLFPTNEVIQLSNVARLPYEATQLTALGAIVLLAIVFYFWGKREQKQEEQQAQLSATTTEKSPVAVID
ncbi:APC family permease [Dictyobacter kobayashii]|uniref:Putative amino acid permease n=1 Tax=Dictyobacter kobayashii TaxID=2014872 RepID=A0A402AMT4_9CHLR|nr:APC family permease [Dictyobacter kobayashii]GCE20402.1 putative amino acid permease [Dictyobacter kobayashii]